MFTDFDRLIYLAENSETNVLGYKGRHSALSFSFVNYDTDPGSSIRLLYALIDYSCKSFLFERVYFLTALEIN